MQWFLNRPIDAAILVYFRFCAGVLISLELINGLTIGKFNDYISPHFHFSYMYFDFIKPWPQWGMVAHYVITIYAGICVALNYHYRFFSRVLFLGLLLLFLFEQTEDINHAYLYCLVSFWMAVFPLNEDKVTQPAWMLYLLLFHISLAYFVGGVVKLNSEWLSGAPIDIFLQERKNHPLGFIYNQSWAPKFFSYAGIIFDLLIIPCMINRPSRRLGFSCAVIFHLSNVAMFGFTTFPWFTLMMISMFFHPSWPRRIPVLREFLPWGVEQPRQFTLNKTLMWVLGCYVFIHLMLPFHLRVS